MKDIFRLEIEQTSKHVLFHDESECEKSKFLYHGFLFLKNKNARNVSDELKRIKKKLGKEKREIHFSELNQHSKSPYGAKTRVALDWLNLSREWLKQDRINFYCFGVDKNNVKDFWSNPDNYEKNIYLRFFEIGLKSSIRWFNLAKIINTFLDNGKHDEGRKQRITWLDSDFWKSKLSHEIDLERVQLISSDENESGTDFSNFIQLADVLLGVTRSSFIQLGENQKGQNECVENFEDIIERFCCKKSAYNTNSKFWKKFCIQFFPTENDLTKEEFLSDNIEDLLKRGNFYCSRLTYKQQLARNKNLELNF